MAAQSADHQRGSEHSGKMCRLALAALASEGERTTAPACAESLRDPKAMSNPLPPLRSELVGWQDELRIKKEVVELVD